MQHNVIHPHHHHSPVPLLDVCTHFHNLVQHEKTQNIEHVICADTQPHLSEKHAPADEQPHLIICKTSTGTGDASSGKETGRSLLTSHVHP